MDPGRRSVATVFIPFDISVPIGSRQGYTQYLSAAWSGTVHARNASSGKPPDDVETRVMRLAGMSAERGEYFVQAFDYETRGGKRHSIFVALPDWVSDPVSADQAFVLGASIAFVLGEDYTQDIPVTETTARNVDDVLSIWHDWHPYKRKIAIRAPVSPDLGSGGRPAAKEACFFTAGIDSLFTAHKLGESSPRRQPLIQS